MILAFVSSCFKHRKLLEKTWRINSLYFSPLNYLLLRDCANSVLLFIYDDVGMILLFVEDLFLKLSITLEKKKEKIL